MRLIFYETHIEFFTFLGVASSSHGTRKSLSGVLLYRLTMIKQLVACAVILAVVASSAFGQVDNFVDNGARILAGSSALSIVLYISGVIVFVGTTGISIIVDLILTVLEALAGASGIFAILALLGLIIYLPILILSIFVGIGGALLGGILILGGWIVGIIGPIIGGLLVLMPAIQSNDMLGVIAGILGLIGGIATIFTGVGVVLSLIGGLLLMLSPRGQPAPAPAPTL